MNITFNAYGINISDLATAISWRIDKDRPRLLQACFGQTIEKIEEIHSINVINCAHITHPIKTYRVFEEIKNNYAEDIFENMLYQYHLRKYTFNT
jgi:hypothetical protein